MAYLSHNTSGGFQPPTSEEESIMGGEDLHLELTHHVEIECERCKGEIEIIAAPERRGYTRIIVAPCVHCAQKGEGRAWLLSRAAKPGGPDEPRRRVEGVALSDQDAQLWKAERGEYDNRAECVPVWSPAVMMVSGDVDTEDPETAEALEDIRQAGARRLRERAGEEG